MLVEKGGPLVVKINMQPTIGVFSESIHNQ